MLDGQPVQGCDCREFEGVSEHPWSGGWAVECRISQAFSLTPILGGGSPGPWWEGSSSLLGRQEITSPAQPSAAVVW